MHHLRLPISLLFILWSNPLLVGEIENHGGRGMSSIVYLNVGDYVCVAADMFFSHVELKQKLAIFATHPASLAEIAKIFAK